MKIQNLLVILTFLICMNIISIVSRTENIEKRIVGGTKTNIVKLGGFLVVLRIGTTFICAGSYVSKRIVISAAHCVVYVLKSISIMTVQGGITNLNEKGPLVQVERALIPDKYNVIANDQDVAVLLLKTPLMDKKVRQIKLCDHVLKKNDKVSVYGWGADNNISTTPKLQVETVDVPVVDRKYCKQMFDADSGEEQITESMLCAGVPYKKDACRMDSGGPLVHKGQLCGIVSYGVDCATKFPGVYSDVKNLSSWIKAAIKKLLS